MKTRNETTSKRVSAIAGRVLRIAAHWKENCGMRAEMCVMSSAGLPDTVTLAELKALAASALSQTPDRKPAKAKKVAKAYSSIRHVSELGKKAKS